ncbi:hypothetical protein [uncultured Shewanella sp.]|uniref:hypothetical protein n=1 Tax=uncultured Shewanella sp. TaxID=173975 RepID=UPI002612FF5E|nr:hypothetical protein [uncultured Shewanella sp.]
MDHLLRSLLGGIAAVLFVPLANADESPWSTQLALNYLSGVYSGDTIKDELSGYGVKGQFNYLAAYDINLGYSRLGIAFDSATFSDTLYQEAFQLELKSHYFIDVLNGALTPSIQFSQIDGNLSDSALGGLSYVGGALNYMSYERDLSFDLHYSRTAYEFNTGVYQYDAAIGGSLFGSRNWGQVRLYDIASQSFDRHYVSADMLIKHWLSAYSLLLPDSLYLAFTVGDRLLAVDPDTLVIANLNQIQKQYIRVGSDWALPNRSQLTLALAYSEYELSTSSSDYSGTFLFLQYATKW